MFESIKKQFKKLIVQAITEGLSLTKEELRSDKKLNNDLNFRKINDINNAILDMIEKYFSDEFKISMVKKGAYLMFEIYNSDSNSLITVMSEGNLKRKKKKFKPTYLDRYVSINAKYKLYPKNEQLYLFDDEKLEPTQNQMINERGSNIPEKYFTIVFDIQGLKLTSVRIIMLNEQKEEIFSEDWSEYIGIDYDDLFDYYDDVNEEAYNSLPMTPKMLDKKDKSDMDSDQYEVDISKKKKEKIKLTII